MRPSTGWMLVAFVAGVAVALGLSYLNTKASVPRIDSTAIFQIVLPDGSIKHLSYSEIERDREELRILRERLRALEDRTQASQRDVQPKAAQSPTSSQPEPKKTAAEGKDQGSTATQGLKEVFTKLMNSATLKTLADEQIMREAGELAAVLDLNKEQRQKVEEAIRKRKKIPSFSLDADATAREQAQAKTEPHTPLEEELRSFVPPEKFARYQEYTEKKKQLTGASALERDLLELTYRLDLSEEQQAAVREVLKEHDEKAQHISLDAGQDEKMTPVERIQTYLEQKIAIDKDIARRMERILNQTQQAAFLQYQNEKSAEIRILKKLLEEDFNNIRTTP